MDRRNTYVDRTGELLRHSSATQVVARYEDAIGQLFQGSNERTMQLRPREPSRMPTGPTMQQIQERHHSRVMLVMQHEEQRRQNQVQNTAGRIEWLGQLARKGRKEEQDLLDRISDTSERTEELKDRILRIREYQIHLQRLIEGAERTSASVMGAGVSLYNAVKRGALMALGSAPTAGASTSSSPQPVTLIPTEYARMSVIDELRGEINDIASREYGTATDINNALRASESRVEALINAIRHDRDNTMHFTMSDVRELVGHAQLQNTRMIENHRSILQDEIHRVQNNANIRFAQIETDVTGLQFAVNQLGAQTHSLGRDLNTVRADVRKLHEAQQKNEAEMRQTRDEAMKRIETHAQTQKQTTSLMQQTHNNALDELQEQARTQDSSIRLQNRRIDRQDEKIEEHVNTTTSQLSTMDSRLRSLHAEVFGNLATDRDTANNAMKLANKTAREMLALRKKMQQLESSTNDSTTTPVSTTAPVSTTTPVSTSTTANPVKEGSSKKDREKMPDVDPGGGPPDDENGGNFPRNVSRIPRASRPSKRDAIIFRITKEAPIINVDVTLNQPEPKKRPPLPDTSGHGKRLKKRRAPINLFRPRKIKV